MTEILFEIVKIIVMIIAAVTGCYVIPWIRQTAADRKLDTAYYWVQQAVLCAQQLLSGQPGEDKKEYVLNVLNGILAQHGITMNGEQLDILIEAAVRELKIAEGRV